MGRREPVEAKRAVREVYAFRKCIGCGGPIVLVDPEDAARVQRTTIGEGDCRYCWSFEEVQVLGEISESAVIRLFDDWIPFSGCRAYRIEVEHIPPEVSP